MSINKPADETSPNHLHKENRDHLHKENGESDASEASNQVHGLPLEQDQIRD